MNHMETLKAVFCFDENLTTQVQVVAASVVDACCRDAHCEIHCVCTPAACVAADALEALIKRKDPDSALVMHCVENPYAGAYEVRGISAGAYLRLLLHRILSDADKVLYLDVDTLVRESLLQIWKIDLGSNVLAAVKGPVNLSEKWEWNSSRPYWNLLSGARGGYINSGVLLLNLEEIRRRQLEVQWEKLAQQKLYYQDQDILNITCQGAITYLPPKYNRLTYLEEEVFGRFTAEGIYTEEECREALHAPVILHYAGDKPWKRYDTNLGSVWWDFVNGYPELAALFDEEKARKYHGPTLAQRGLRKLQRLLSGERL